MRVAHNSASSFSASVLKFFFLEDIFFLVLRLSLILLNGLVRT